MDETGFVYAKCRGCERVMLFHKIDRYGDGFYCSKCLRLVEKEEDNKEGIDYKEGGSYEKK